MTKESTEIRAFYEELQGLLSQAPLPKEQPHISEPSIWTHYNRIVEKLSAETSNEDYLEYKLTISSDTWMDGSHHERISTTEYRTKLNGLIMRLHAEFFSKENTPFGGTSSLSISQNQFSNMSVQISNVIEIQSVIEKHLSENKLPASEKGFLEKLKESLPTAKNAVELINLVLSLASSFGLSPERLSQLFK